MTVSNNNNNGNSSNTVFTFDFRILDQNDIDVYLTENGTDTLQSLTTHYTVSGVGDVEGGEVTFNTPPTSDQIVTMIHGLPTTQEESYVEADRFPAVAHETALDRQALISAKLEELISRCFKVPIGTDTSLFTTMLSSIVGKGRAVLQLNEAETELLWSAPNEVFDTSDYMSSAVSGTNPDENWDAVGKRIVNLADGINAQDAATVSQLNAATGTPPTLPIVTADQAGLAGDYNSSTKATSSFTDDAPALQNALFEWAEKGGAYFMLYPENENSYFYFNNSINIPSNCTVDFVGHRIYFGALARFRTFGSYAEEGPAFADNGSESLGQIANDIGSGTTVIPLDQDDPSGASDASNYTVGDFLIFRGENDANGNVLNTADRPRVTAINVGSNTLTISPALNNSYKTSYPSSAWTPPPSGVDRTTISLAKAGLLASNVTRGSNRITLASGKGALFSRGNYVLIQDEQRVKDVYTDTTSNNLMRREIARIIGVSGDVLILDRNLHHSYDTVNLAHVVLLDHVENSHVKNTHVHFHENSTNRNYHPFEMAYSVGCSVTNCSTNRDFVNDIGWAGQSFRIFLSVDCLVDKCSVNSPLFVDSGEGYGFTLYSCNGCRITNVYASGCRHTILFFAGAAGNTVKNVTSIDCLISDLDLHGANEVDNIIDGAFCISGERQAEDGTTSKTAIKIGNTFHLAGAHRNTVRNVYITGFNTSTPINYTSRAIEILPVSQDNLIENIFAEGCEYGIFMRDLSRGSPSTLKMEDNVIQNCLFVRCTQWAVYADCSSNGSVTRVVDGLTLKDIWAVECAKGLSLKQCNDIDIRDFNTLRPTGSEDYAYNFNNITNLRARGGVIRGDEKGVSAVTCPDFVVQDVVFDGLTKNTIFKDGGGNGGYLWLDNDYPNTPSPAFDLTGGSAKGEERHRGVGHIYKTSGSENYSTSGTPITANIPFDDTVPQVSEGGEIVSTNFTPSVPTGKLLVTLIIPFVSADTKEHITAAVFVGSELIAVASMSVAAAGNGITIQCIGEYEFTATTQVTISARIGAETASTTNVTVGGKFGDNGHPHMIIKEINR
ncbi:MAG: right-handed parallel beta-helix repeat-containing protein [Rickettsiales bacterium]|nr:right-handed parallel beta-helix repeat-containing protein [Rickettsiales bacterium]